MINQLKEVLKKISSEWNGDESGVLEERAESAEEALRIIKMFEEAEDVKYPQGLERLMELLDYLD